VCLPPAAYADLMALDELAEPHICPTCYEEWLQENLHKTCDRCGETYADPVVKAQLERP